MTELENLQLNKTPKIEPIKGILGTQNSRELVPLGLGASLEARAGTDLRSEIINQDFPLLDTELEVRDQIIIKTQPNTPR